MNENETQVLDIQDDDWSDIDLSDVAGIEPGTPAPEADQPTEPEVQEPVAEEQPQVQAEADHSFQLKHLDEVRTVNRDEVITLAQKGLDYDRIKARLDDRTASDKKAADALAFLEDIAAKSGQSVDDFMDSVVASQRAKPDRSDYDAVLAQVKLERREKALAEREAQLDAAKKQDAEKAQAADRRQNDIKNFMQRFPSVKADAIPKEVWAKVSGGMTLTEAYAMHRAEQLERDLETERQNAKNAARPAGSRATAGASDTDEFDRLWYSDD